MLWIGSECGFVGVGPTRLGKTGCGLATRRKNQGFNRSARGLSRVTMIENVCPSTAMLEHLIKERHFGMRAASSHIRSENRLVGSDSSFVLAEEGFLGVADTGIADAAKVYGEAMAARVRFENRTILDNIVRNILFSRPESRWTDIRRYLDSALNHVTFPKSASTCIMSLEDQKLRAAWVGSAGFMVFRGDRVIFNSVPQARRRLEDSFAASGDRSRSGRVVPRHVVIDVEEDDLIVVATDGLWDNVSEEQIRSYIRPEHMPGISSQVDDPKQQSSVLAHLGDAYGELEEGDNYLSQRFVSGATHDDVTVIVATITKGI